MQAKGGAKNPVTPPPEVSEAYIQQKIEMIQRQANEQRKREEAKAQQIIKMQEQALVHPPDKGARPNTQLPEKRPPVEEVKQASQFPARPNFLNDAALSSIHNTVTGGRVTTSIDQENNHPFNES
jgi:hypothetical protein